MCIRDRIHTDRLEMIAYTLVMPIDITGDWVDEWGTEHSVDSDSWNENTITQYDNHEMWAVAQNSEDDQYYPGLWSKYDWTWESEELYYCQSPFGADTEADALSAESANASDLAAGCGGFPWSLMEEAGHDDHGDDHDDHSDEEDDHDDHEEDHHEPGYVSIHIDEEGDYGFAVPNDVEFYVLAEAPSPFEWAGIFSITDSAHTWTMEKVDGAYADPSMRVVIIPTDTPTEDTMHSLEDGVEEMIEGDSCTVVEDGGTMTPISSDGSCFELHVGSGDMSTFNMDTAGITGFAAFTAHSPYEFENTQHYLKDSSGNDVEHVAEESAGGHAHHDHGAHGGESEIEAGEGEEAFDYDPHSWLDPLSFNEQLNLVLEILTTTFPDGADAFAENAAAYSAQLIELHGAFEQTLGQQGTCETGGLTKTIIANHNAYSYISLRYDFDIMTVHGLDPEGEPSPAEVAEVVEKINEEGITVLFVEEYTDQTAVQSIVEETGVEVKILYTMEMRPSDSQDDYLSMMNKNINNIATGLGC